MIILLATQTRNQKGCFRKQNRFTYS